jgi:hypothetical protein
MCAEGQAARTAAADVRGTGAMEGSPQRLAKMVEQAERCTGNTLVRRSSTARELQPHEWRLGGERLPSKTELIEQALRRWFPNAVGRVYYGQVSRPAHIDPLVAHAFVDRNLVVASSENAAGNAISALGMWGSAWYYLLSYMGLRDSTFDQWRRRAFAVARSDRRDRTDRVDA